MSWRGAVRWVLWSPRRLLVVLLAGLLLVVAVGSHAGQGSSNQANGRGGRGAATVRSAPPAPPHRHRANATTAAHLPAGAEAAAVAFVRSWAQPGLAEPQWLAALQPLATPTYANVLEDEEPWSVPAHRVTGSPSGRGDPGGATVTVPTDAGTVVVTVVQVGGSWLVANVQSSP